MRLPYRSRRMTTSRSLPNPNISGINIPPFPILFLCLRAVDRLLLPSLTSSEQSQALTPAKAQCGACGVPTLPLQTRAPWSWQPRRPAKCVPKRFENALGPTFANCLLKHLRVRHVYE